MRLNLVQVSRRGVRRVAQGASEFEVRHNFLGRFLRLRRRGATIVIRHLDGGRYIRVRRLVFGDNMTFTITNNDTGRNSV